MKKLLSAICLFAISPCFAGVISHTDYTAGNVITAAGQNANENTIVNEFNGNINSANIAAQGVALTNIVKGSANTLMAMDPTATVVWGSSVAVSTFNITTAEMFNGILTGHFLQLVSSISVTNTSYSGNTFTDTNLKAVITPRSSTSTIIIFASGGLQATASGALFSFATIARAGTNLASSAGLCQSETGTSIGAVAETCSLLWVEHSPGAGSSVTYSVQIRNSDNSTQVNWPSSSQALSTSMIVLEYLP